ncbi:MAG: twin-arginine translocation signal domain-containing protein, partial [Deltaproteobacteria bacterium]|nr:twin-arginine translocation signal domain-containing protein [Deltaproteobacteria bacterium]
MSDHQKWTHVTRRGFFKTTAVAGVAAALPVSILAGEKIISIGGIKPTPAGKKRNLLFVSDAPERYEELLGAVRSISEYEINLSQMKADFKNSGEILKTIKEKDADICLFTLPGVGMSSRNIAEQIGYMDIPVVILAGTPELIMWETDLAASFRIKGINTLVANSDDHAVELIKILSAPRPLEGKKALVFGKPFGSTSVPSPNLNEEYVFSQTGVRVTHRSIDDLKTLIKGVDEKAARKEMERWKSGAKKIIDVSDEMLLHSSRITVLLKSLIEKEGLSAVSVDCLNFSFGADATIPLPCLAFTSLRDEGMTAECEADICMMLTSMLLQEIAKRPSFQSNVSAVDIKNSSTMLRHCVAPTKIFGVNAPQQPYNLRDYHGLGKGGTCEIDYPVGLDVTIGGFSKDLKNFVIWPGRIMETVD